MILPKFRIFGYILKLRTSEYNNYLYPIKEGPQKQNRGGENSKLQVQYSIFYPYAIKYIIVMHPLLSDQYIVIRRLIHFILCHMIQYNNNKSPNILCYNTLL